MEDRKSIIDKIQKLNRLSVSERKLGNVGAADTIDEKVKSITLKYSITHTEINGGTYTQTKTSQSYYKEPEPRKTHNSYSSYDDVFNHMAEEMRREREKSRAYEKDTFDAYARYRRGQADGRGKYGPFGYDPFNEEPKEEKTYRYKSIVIFPKDSNPASTIQKLCRSLDLEIEILKVYADKGWLGIRTFEYQVEFSVKGSNENLSLFKSAITVLTN